MSSIPQEHPNAPHLRSATKGFDHLFANEIVEARAAFEAEDSPFHMLGLGVCAFLEAALGMESGLMAEATRCLTLSEAGAKKKLKSSKTRSNQRFPPGLEWEILIADAVVLLGLTNALSESYMGYFQCMYALNSAHGKFTKLYKTVFPTGLDQYSTPTTSLSPSRTSSNPSLTSITLSPPPASKSGLFGRWTGSGSSLTVPSTPVTPFTPNTPDSPTTPLDGPVEELIVAGTAFGFGLFNLVFSLLPGKIQSVVGFFGFKHDRKLALRALAVSAAKKDVHSVFAGLVLMTYHGVVLLLSGYQADEAHIIKQYRSIVDSVEPRYPTGALWILNRAKILRMSHDAEGAIRVLRDGLKPERPHTFAQADTLLVFELAWTLLAQRRYQESADMFIKITELNSWSHATYYFIAAGCYMSLGNTEKAQQLFNTIPNLLEKRKINGKDLPTEVLIKKKLEFYKAKQVRRGGVEADYVQAIKISPAEEIAIFWNTHARVDKAIAESHIKEWVILTPPPTIPSPYIETLTTTTTTAPTPHQDLDNPDELALRSLLLGILHRTAGAYTAARAFLSDAQKLHPQVKVSTWIGGVAVFELAVLDLRECEDGEASGEVVVEKVGSVGKGNGGKEKVGKNEAWIRALGDASAKLDLALGLAGNTTDLSSRLDSRIAMLRDEIATKREMLGIV